MAQFLRDLAVFNPSERRELDPRFYRSLRAVKVVSPTFARRSPPLTVLARKAEGLYRFTPRSSCRWAAAGSLRCRESLTKRLRNLRFHLFEFFPRHTTALRSFDHVVEQDLPFPSFSPCCNSFSRDCALRL